MRSWLSFRCFDSMFLLSLSYLLFLSLSYTSMSICLNKFYFKVTFVKAHERNLMIILRLTWIDDNFNDNYLIKVLHQVSTDNYFVLIVKVFIVFCFFLIQFVWIYCAVHNHDIHVMLLLLHSKGRLDLYLILFTTFSSTESLLISIYQPSMTNNLFFK